MGFYLRGTYVSFLQLCHCEYNLVLIYQIASKLSWDSKLRLMRKLIVIAAFHVDSHYASALNRYRQNLGFKIAQLS